MNNKTEHDQFKLINELNEINRNNEETLEEGMKETVAALIVATIGALSSGNAQAIDNDMVRSLSKERVEHVQSISANTYEAVKRQYMEQRGIKSEEQLTTRDKNFIRAKAENLTSSKLNLPSQNKSNNQLNREAQNKTNSSQRSHVRRTTMGNDW